MLLLYHDGKSSRILEVLKSIVSYSETVQNVGSVVGEGEGGMFRENSIETRILSGVKQVTSPGGMHETSAQAWKDPEESGGEGDGRGDRGIHVIPWLIHVNV